MRPEDKLVLELVSLMILPLAAWLLWEDSYLNIPGKARIFRKALWMVSPLPIGAAMVILTGEKWWFLASVLIPPIFNQVRLVGERKGRERSEILRQRKLMFEEDFTSKWP